MPTFFTFPLSTFFIVMETMVLSERETCGVFITSNFSYIDKSFPIEMRRYEKLSEENRNSIFSDK